MAEKSKPKKQGISKKQFKDEIELEHGTKLIQADIDKIYDEFKEKVEPNLELISHWRFEKKLKVPEIGIILDVDKNSWEVIKRMETVYNYLHTDGSFLSSKLDKEFLESLRENKGNAKFWDMAFKEYKNKKQDKTDTNSNLTFNIVNGSMSEQDIEKKAKLDTDKEK